MPPARSVTSLRRSVLERVLDVVRHLGAADSLSDTLDLIADAAVQILEFGACAINVTTPGGSVQTVAVAGPAELRSLLGNSTPLAAWLELIEACERWGSLRFYGHERDQVVFEAVGRSWSADYVATGAADPTLPDWHPDDALLAPLWSTDNRLLGVLSVDQPASGHLPDLEQRTVLELFAAQAAIAISDSQAREQSERRRQEAERRWELTFNRSPVGAAIVNEQGEFVQVNDTLVEVLGYPRARLEGSRVADITHADDLDENLQLFAELLAGTRDSYEMEKRFIHADGHLVWGQLHVGMVHDPRTGARSIISQVADITELKNAEEALDHRTRYDLLTALPNRSQLEVLLNELLRAGRPAGVLFLDLDRFKTVNDSLGHDAGDELLRSVTRLLASAIGPDDVLGRVGGDEFALIVHEQIDPDRLGAIGRALMSTLAEPILVRGHEHTISASVGVTTTRPGHSHADEVLREADQAMLRAKRHGRARVEFYDPEQDRPATVEDLELEHALRVALVEDRGLLPYYQPIIDLVDNRIAGYEALVRWKHARLGLLDPDRFLPLAEATGLIVPLGWWMLGNICRAAADPTFGEAEQRWVAVNVSGSQLGRGLLLGEVSRALSDSGLSADRLHLEITETALIEASSAAIREVRQVADLGVSVALDDFGTGYSSLTLLRDLPVSIVKIDRSFIAPIGVDRSATAIVRRVIALCQELGVTTVAEGIETQSQLTALRALGCTQAQGYLIGPPEPLGGSPASWGQRGRSSA